MKNKSRQGSKELSLTSIYTTLIASALLVMAIVTMLLFSSIYQNTMESGAITNSRQVVSQVGNTIETYTANMSNLIESIKSNMGTQAESSNFITNLLETQPDVVAVTAYDQNKNLVGHWPEHLVVKEEYLCNLSYVEGNSTTEVLNVSKPHVESIFEGYYPWVVTISTDIMTTAGNTLHLAIDIRFSSIAKYVDNVGIGQHGYCYVLDKQGNIIYHPQQQLIYAGLKDEVQTDLTEGSTIREDAIYTTLSLANCDWRVVGVCYVDEMVTSKVQKMSFILFAILMIVCVITCFVGVLFSFQFSRPVKHLAESMSEFEHQSEQFVFEPVKGTKEITLLSDSFHHMSEKIQELMEQVRREEVSLRKTELKALQAQINPHFLYNTLDAIEWMCEDNRNEDAAEMVNALARLFRISISKGHELIPIEKELQHAQSYLKIQNFRYKNQFTYELKVEEECLSYYCNKITLQPIIENAILHGINRMVEEGMIRISVRMEEEDIVFVVEDNGVGMTEEQCQEILSKEQSDRTGIGIKNVNDRIRIYFGERYGLTIDSELDEGTTVTIRLPKITGEGGAAKYEKK